MSGNFFAWFINSVNYKELTTLNLSVIVLRRKERNLIDWFIWLLSYFIHELNSTIHTCGPLTGSGTAQGGGAGGEGVSRPHPPHFFGWFNDFFYLFYFGYPDLSLTTQRRFSSPTILYTHKQRTDKLCLQVAVANEFVALNDNRKGNFGSFRESDLKMSGWHSTVLCVGPKSIHLNFGLTWGSGCNLLF